MDFKSRDGTLGETRRDVRYALACRREVVKILKRTRVIANPFLDRLLLQPTPS